MSQPQAPSSPRPRVLCCWTPDLGDALLGGLRDVADVEWAPPSRELLATRLHEFDAYLASLHIPLDRVMIANAARGRLRLVATPSTGLDHLDLPALESSGVRLISLRGEEALLGRITSTAEQAWGLLLAAVRRIPAGHAAACRGEWARDRFRGTQLAGKTLGVIGVGRLGSMVAQYGLAFRMRVLGCDPRPIDIPGVERVDLDALLRAADILSLHVHLTPQTRGLLGPAQFALMKPGVVLINTSRGAIVDEAALLDALRTGRVAAAGLDVIDGEWRADLVDHPLIRHAREHENLVISPHVGGVTVEAQTITHAFLADRVAEALRN
ncbi:MAG: hypothetical protein NTW19_21620 [Planctomycetota bacterium]|nr:hypothetical protein [Planctomycetota bacterium]